MNRLDPGQIVQAIQKSKLLQPLSSEEALATLVRSVRHVHVESSDILFAKGSIAHYEVAGTESGVLRIEHGFSQQDLADSLGLTRVMVNRQLSALRDLGLIDYGRGFIEIHDHDALEEPIWSDISPQ